MCWGCVGGVLGVCWGVCWVCVLGVCWGGVREGLARGGTCTSLSHFGKMSGVVARYAPYPGFFPYAFSAKATPSPTAPEACPLKSASRSAGLRAAAASLSAGARRLSPGCVEETAVVDIIEEAGCDMWGETGCDVWGETRCDVWGETGCDVWGETRCDEWGKWMCERQLPL